MKIYNNVLYYICKTNINMRKKVEKWYEVIYTEGGHTYQVLSRGRRESMNLHKYHPGSTFRIITK